MTAAPTDDNPGRSQSTEATSGGVLIPEAVAASARQTDEGAERRQRLRVAACAGLQEGVDLGPAWSDNQACVGVVAQRRREDPRVVSPAELGDRHLVSRYGAVLPFEAHERAGRRGAICPSSVVDVHLRALASAPTHGLLDPGAPATACVSSWWRGTGSAAKAR